MLKNQKKPKYSLRTTTSHLKKRILVQDVGGIEFKTADIRRYVEDLEPGSNAQIGLKDFFEITCTQVLLKVLVSFTIFAICVGGHASNAASEVEPSTRKKQAQVVHEAVALYKNGDHKAAKERFEEVESVFPDNYAVHYYLGLINLEEGNHSVAISHWRRYVALDSHSENSIKVRKYLTLLVRNQAMVNARRAVAQETIRMKTPVTGNAIAVTTFENIGYMILGPLGKGIAAMLISDLSRVPDLDVVNRIQLHALLQEMSLGTSGLVDADTASRVGRLLRANHMVAGRLQDLETDNLEIASSVMDTMGEKSADTQQTKGTLKQFYDMEKEIACKIVSDLGKKCDTMPPDFHKVHTHNISALVAFSWGLDYFDQGEFDQAREMFQKALEKDPDFALAQEALLTTPTNSIAVMSTDEIISDLSSETIVGSPVGSTSTRGGGIGKKVLIGGGIAGGGIALASLAGGGGSTNPPGSEKTNLTGLWSGALNNVPDTADLFEFTMELRHSDSSFTGEISFNDWACMSSAKVSGKTDTINNQKRITLRIESTSSDSITMEGTFSDDKIEAKITDRNHNAFQCIMISIVGSTVTINKQS